MAVEEDINYVEGETIEHEGGDAWAYKDGIWETQLIELHGWYYRQEPEGQRYGMFSSVLLKKPRIAVSGSANNYTTFSYY